MATKKRSCGSCKECCTHIGVLEFGKPPGVPCEHVCSKGCGIYESRPKGCSDFQCLWLYGELSINDRPDKSGMVCWVTRSELARENGENKICLYGSHRPGKPHKKTLSYLVKKSYGFPVIITPMKGNDPAIRTIWWQGEKIVNKGKIKEGYENRNTGER